MLAVLALLQRKQQPLRRHTYTLHTRPVRSQDLAYRVYGRAGLVCAPGWSWREIAGAEGAAPRWLT